MFFQLQALESFETIISLDKHIWTENSSSHEKSVKRECQRKRSHQNFIWQETEGKQSCNLTSLSQQFRQMI